MFPVNARLLHQVPGVYAGVLISQLKTQKCYVYGIHGLPSIEN